MDSLTQKELKCLLHYNPDTGIFTNKTTRYRAIKGSVAGDRSRKNYIQISIKGKRYLAHRLAWLYCYGYFPENYIDHINRNPDDNRIKNLREISPQCNIRNSGNFKDNTSGVRGINWHEENKSWVASIVINLKKFHIGTSKDFTEAVALRLAAEQCVGWDGCDNSSPAYKYMQKTLNQKENEKCSGF